MQYACVQSDKFTFLCYLESVLILLINSLELIISTGRVTFVNPGILVGSGSRFSEAWDPDPIFL